MRDLASKLEHSNCLSENHGFDNYGPIPKVTIVKEPDSINKDVANEKNRSMFTPKMLGLNTPEQDLHNLGEFGKSVKNSIMFCRVQRDSLQNKSIS